MRDVYQKIERYNKIRKLANQLYEELQKEADLYAHNEDQHESIRHWEGVKFPIIKYQMLQSKSISVAIEKIFYDLYCQPSIQPKIVEGEV